MLPFTLPPVQRNTALLISPSAENKVSLKDGLHCYLLQWKESCRVFLVQLLPSAPVIISHLVFYIDLLQHLLSAVTDIPNRSNHCSIRVQMRCHYGPAVSQQFIRQQSTGNDSWVDQSKGTEMRCFPPTLSGELMGLGN